MSPALLLSIVSGYFLLLLGIDLLVFFITREVYRPAPPEEEG